MSLPITPSQTVGPYHAIGLTWPEARFVVPEGTPGAILIRGRILDGHGDPVPDGLVETWQAGPDGRFAEHGDPSTGFRGFGRCATDADGGYAILTLKPGSVAGPDGAGQAPHIDVSIFARGLLKHLVTRIYFDDEPDANTADPVLRGIDDADRRATLIATRTEDGYAFDIRLQGERETVFFQL